MTSRLIENKVDLTHFLKLPAFVKFPYVLTIEPGKKRSIEQNRLQRLWMMEAEAQGDQRAEEYRGYCKLHYGVPILRSENKEFKSAYDKYIRPLDYETKLAMMMVPLDFPVTRLMTTKQKTRYLDEVYQHFSNLGMILTQPEAA